MLIVRKTAAGTYVELASNDPLLEQVDVSYDVPREVLTDGEVLASIVSIASTAVLRHDWNWARAADDGTLAGLGYWKLQQVDVPEGKRQIGYSIQDQEGEPVLVPEYEDLPTPPPPPPPPPPAIPSITFRQFLLQALVDGMISAEEALAAADAGRQMPATIAAVFDALPANLQVPARITWKTMSQVDRLDVLTDLVAAAFEMDAEATDAFFVAAAQL